MKSCSIALIVLSIILFSCSKGGDGTDGINGKTSLIDFVNEPAGANCNNGGYKILSGVDQNSNGTLEASEIQNTKYICNGGGSGSNGSNSLISFVAESAGQNCANGGYKVSSGLDANNNNVLDAAEVRNTQFICNGAPGQSGGTGANGFNTLVAVVNESAGTNCTNGGKKINYGLDQNRNGVLDNNEITTSTYVCNTTAGGGTNGFSSLVSVVTEPIGANCAGGGNRIYYGLDVNRNNVLDIGEITNTTYMCNANRVYAAVVSQSSTGAPIGIPIVNNLDVTITWTRTGVGLYRGVINKSMNLQKTIPLSNNTGLTATLQNATTILLENRCAVNTLCDGFTNATVGLLVVD